MKINKIIIPLLLALGFIIPAAHAQNSTVSPYSRFGYGLLSDQANTTQRSMGGVGYAMRSGRQINFMNPASYAAIDTLTFLFDMGLDLKSVSTTEGDLKGSNLTGGLSYLSLQFPVTRYGGMAVGLIPFSEVGYSFGNEIVNGHNSREGSGGFSQLFVGLSAKPFKGLTLGANISYLFGTTLNDTYVYTDNSSTSLFERVLQIRDYNLRFGLQYGFKVGGIHEVTIGAVYSPKKSFRGHTYGVKYDVTADSKPDTIGYTSLKGKYDMPETWGAGISYTWRDRLTVEADFTYQPWKNAAFANIEGFDGATTTTFNDRWKAALGFQYTPKLRGSWIQRVNYRIGAYHSRDYIKVGDNSLKETGVSIGFGLPAPSSKTMVNLAFEFRTRRATPEPLVKENYFLVTLGINFNEMWFWRNKLR